MRGHRRRLTQPCGGSVWANQTTERTEPTPLCTRWALKHRVGLSPLPSMRSQRHPRALRRTGIGPRPTAPALALEPRVKTPCSAPICWASMQDEETMCTEMWG